MEAKRDVSFVQGDVLEGGVCVCVSGWGVGGRFGEGSFV